MMRLHVIGPDLFCPDCGRWLVRVHEDGTFDLTGHSSVTLHAEVELSTLEQTDDGKFVVETTALEAECNALLCRGRRWLKVV